MTDDVDDAKREIWTSEELQLGERQPDDLNIRLFRNVPGASEDFNEAIATRYGSEEKWELCNLWLSEDQVRQLRDELTRLLVE